MNQSTAVGSHVLTTAVVAMLIDVAENLPARVDCLEAAVDLSVLAHGVAVAIEVAA